MNPDSTLPASPSDPGPAHGLLVSSTGTGLKCSLVSPTATSLPDALDHESQTQDEQDTQQRTLTMPRSESAVVETRPSPLPIAYVGTTAVLTRFTTGSSTYLFFQYSRQTGLTVLTRKSLYPCSSAPSQHCRDCNQHLDPDAFLP